VLPQFEQFIGDRVLPAELYRAELLVPVGARWHGAVSLDARRDFLIAGASGHVDFWSTPRSEWRAAVGAGYTLPLGDSETLFRRYDGEGSGLLDRLNLRLGLGQTFDIQGRAVALRVEYDARFVLRGSLLSVLEALDDGVDTESTFVVHEIVAGVEMRWGGEP
jgi:hypothetical protein